MTSDLPTATIAPARTWSAVLFDLDGTIVDSASEIMDSLAHMFTEMGVPVPDQEILRSYVGPPLLDSLRMTAGFTDVDAWEALNVYRDHYDEHLLRSPVFPGVKGLLHRLHAAGMPIALATSKPESMARNVLAHHDLDQYFTTIAGASDDETRSTKADVVAEALRRLREVGVDTENAVMIGYEIHVGTPKTQEHRSVPYPARLAPMIEQACAGKGPEGLLFGDGVHHMRNSGAQGWFANAVRRAQALDPSIPRLTPHDLRHTAASLAISAGANVKAVQRMLGHASASMTLDVYAELFEDDLDDVAIGRDQRIAVEREIHLDDPDCFFARHRLGDEDVDLALDVVVHDQPLAGQTFVEVQDVEHVAVRELHRDHVGASTGRAGASLIRAAGHPRG